MLRFDRKQQNSVNQLSLNKKLILSVHMYAPYNFALNADSTYDKFLESYKTELTTNFKALYDKFVSKNIQIILGEMGTLNKNNTEDRINYGKFYRFGKEVPSGVVRHRGRAGEHHRYSQKCD